MNEYETIIKGMHLGVSKHLTDKHFTILWANENAFDLIGYKREEFRVKYHNKVDEYYKEDNQTFERVSNIIKEAYLKENSIYTFECPMKTKRGTTVWIQMSGMFSGEVYRGTPIIWNVFYDITESMEERQEIIRKTELLERELQKTNKMKIWTIDFLEELTGDIRSLVSVIAGMTDVAEIYSADQKTYKKCLQNIRTISKKLKKKIYDANRLFQQEVS